MLQVQNGRLHLNWLGEGGEEYPRFPQVREEFEKYVALLCQFVEDSQISRIHFDQWEVTYVNKIPQILWKTPADWDFFKPLNGMPSIEGVVEAESFSGEWHFVIPDKQGRLHIHWQHAREADADEASHVRLTLTARGPLRDDVPEVEALFSGLDLGRSTIVNSFKHLMNETANREWRLRDATHC